MAIKKAHKQIDEQMDRIRTLHNELNGLYGQIALKLTIMPYTEEKAGQLLALVKRYYMLGDFDQDAKDTIDRDVDAFLAEWAEEPFPSS